MAARRAPSLERDAARRRSARASVSILRHNAVFGLPDLASGAGAGPRIQLPRRLRARFFGSGWRFSRSRAKSVRAAHLRLWFLPFSVGEVRSEAPPQEQVERRPSGAVIPRRQKRRSQERIGAEEGT